LSVRPRELLKRAVPGYAADTFLVLAAWYYQAKKLDLNTAEAISGLRKEDFLAFVNKRAPRGVSWAAEAEVLAKKRAENSGTFAALLAEKGEHESYSYNLLRARNLFAGTKVVRLPFSRVRQLFKLPGDKIVYLKKTGRLSIGGETFTIDDLAAMSAMQFRKLTYPYRSAAKQRATWADKAKKLAVALNCGEGDAVRRELGVSIKMFSRLTRCYSHFKSTPIENMSLRRAVALLSLGGKKMANLTIRGYVVLQKKRYSIEELSEIKFSALGQLISSSKGE
jgi:hypothetical protein